MPTNHNELEKRLWEAADELRANSRLRSSEYSVPVLGLIFLRWSDQKFTQIQKVLKTEQQPSSSRRRRSISKIDYHARGVIFLPESARFSKLIKLPESADIGKAINDAMHAIESENEDLRGVLPKTYNLLGNDVIFALLRIFNSIPVDIEGDAFGTMYEYFLGKFAMSEGQRGGEFFTPTSLVKLIVEILEPFHGRILDPACGSGGMFVQSAHFVTEHQKNPSEQISIYGQERVDGTVRLCKMNLAVHGLSGDIKQGNTYYEDMHDSFGKFDFVMANPPFNVNKVNRDRIKDDPRFPLGIPRVDNANYLWIQIFCSALNERGRAGFVMTNSASTARSSELEIRKKMIHAGVVDVMIAVGPNFFYTVPLSCTLWFLDKAKRSTPREKTVLFINARQIFHKIDRVHCEFSPAQIEFLANIVRLYRGEQVEMRHQYSDKTDRNQEGISLIWDEIFPNNQYRDVVGLCKVATIDEIGALGWSLNPSRYVGVRKYEEESDISELLKKLNEKLEILNVEAQELEKRIAEKMKLMFQGDPL